jgi:hypothetical protein
VIRCLFDPWIQGKKSGSGINNNSDHISESLETIFWVKIPYLNTGIQDGKIRIRDPGWKNSDPGSATLVNCCRDGVQSEHVLCEAVLRIDVISWKQIRGFLPYFFLLIKNSGK